MKQPKRDILSSFSPSDIVQPQSLIRAIGLYAATALIMGNMIGSGIFKKVAPMSNDLQSPGWVLLAWALAGFVTLCGSLTNAEIAGIIAEPGGQYIYFRRMYGKFFAFLYGWSCFSVIQCASQASMAYVFAHSFNALVELPRLGPAWEAIHWFGYFYPFDNFGVKILTVGVIATLTTINYFGVKYGSALSSIAASAVVVCITGIVLLGVSMGNGDVANLSSQGPHPHGDPASFSFIRAMFTAMVGAFWAYDGWNNLSALGGEVKNPRRTIPLALTIGVSAVTVIYLLVNVTYLYIQPISNIIQVFHQDLNKIAGIEIVRSFLGNSGALFVSLLILLATFNSTNSSILANARIYYAMANEGLFFRPAAKVHPVYRTPAIALILQGIWGSVLVFSGSFDQLTDMLIFAAFIFYGSTALGVFVLRYKMPDVPRPYRAIGYPVLPAFFVLFCAVLVVIALLERPQESLTGLVLMLTGIPFYWTWRKRSV